MGAYRTYRRIATNVYWSGMIQHVQRFVAGCLICQYNKYDMLAPVDLLHPIPIPTQVWSDILMDFITDLSRLNGFDCCGG